MFSYQQYDFANGMPKRRSNITAYESGGGEIRTHETFRPSGFQDRRDQPLCHPSKVVAGGVDAAPRSATAATTCHRSELEQDSSLSVGRPIVRRSQTAAKEEIRSTGQYVHVNLLHGDAKEIPPGGQRDSAKPCAYPRTWRLLESGKPVRKAAC